MSFPEDEDVSGFVFSRLHQRKPKLGKELNKLRNNLLEEARGAADTNMKVSQHLDLHAAR